MIKAKKPTLLIIATLLLPLSHLAACKPTAEQSVPAETAAAPSEKPAAIAEPVAPLPITSQHAVEPRSSVYSSLKKAGLNPQVIHEIVKASRNVSRLDRVQSGTQFIITWLDDSRTAPKSLEFLRSPAESLVVATQADGSWLAELVEHPVTIVQKTFSGTVTSSLWDSATSAGMDPSLISGLAEVFAWQVDFAREVREGDRWRLTVEQRSVNNEIIGWGNILAAEYVNAGELYTAVRFPQSGSPASYYAPDGSSLKRMFLKSPLRFARITSGFNPRRFHPVLKTRRPHNGVDYGAPPGTPVMAVGKGTVVFVGRRRAPGKMVAIRHNSVYKTAYMHLKGFAKGIKRGSRVEQGQVIGYVGSTGLATGPHLHFAFYENGRFVNPQGRKFPSADPVATSDLPAFKDLVSVIVQSLPQWNVVAAGESPESLGADKIKATESM